MKIAVMVNSLMEVGGVAKHTIYLSREFANMGHEVTVWAIEYDNEKCYPELTKGLDIHALRRASRLFPTAGHLPGSGMIASLRSVHAAQQDQWRLFQAMQQGYDVLNPHGNLIVWAAAEYKRKYGVPVVWMCNDFWPLGNFSSKVSASKFQNLTSFIKHILTLPIETYDLAAVRDINKIAVLSELVRSQMAKYYSISPIVVRKGVDAERFAVGNGKCMRTHYSIQDGSFLLLTVCTLMPRRKLEEVIQAVDILVNQGYDIIYLIAGQTTHTPEYTQFIYAEITARHLENRVLVVGELTEEELVGCYQACNSFIWQADEGQSWGSAGMEAMSAGKPIIVSKANGLAEILEEGVNGFLVPPRNPTAIVEVIKRLISDPELARSVGKAAQETMREKFSWRNYAERMLGLFQSAMAKP
jgi:glycosyltransferase involved in cell wall biosynthesis